jgi:hypothetical protein
VANAFKEKSQRTWNQALACKGHELFDAAANRSYYAVFQAVIGYEEFRRQEKVEVQGKHQLALDVVRKKCGPGQMNLLKKLYTLRIKADYFPESVKESELERLILPMQDLRLLCITLCEQ